MVRTRAQEFKNEDYTDDMDIDRELPLRTSETPGVISTLDPFIANVANATLPVAPEAEAVSTQTSNYLDASSKFTANTLSFSPSSDTHLLGEGRSGLTPIPSVLDQMANRSKNLMQTMIKLSELGVENEVPLPKVVVVGDQSAGKSSLVEGLSGIKVPRSSGTCTRVS